MNKSLLAAALIALAITACGKKEEAPAPVVEVTPAPVVVAPAPEAAPAVSAPAADAASATAAPAAPAK